MDILLVGIGLIVVLVGAAIGGFIAVLLVEGIGYAKLDKRVFSLEQGGKSALGVQARQEKAERMSEAMAKAVIIMKGEGEQKEKMNKVLALAGEYPDVAFDLVKKVGIKGLF